MTTPNLTTGEEFTTLLNCRNVVIERIVSSNQPEQKIYQQPQDEWVIVLQGEAKLMLNERVLTLQAGDYLFIPQNISHQVLETSASCLWLAIHIYDNGELRIDNGE